MTAPPAWSFPRRCPLLELIGIVKCMGKRLLQLLSIAVLTVACVVQDDSKSGASAEAEESGRLRIKNASVVVRRGRDSLGYDSFRDTRRRMSHSQTIQTTASSSTATVASHSSCAFAMSNELVIHVLGNAGNVTLKSLS